MERLLNKQVKILVSLPKSLYYDAIIINITKTHVTFIDRENRLYTYDLSLIKEISEA